MKLFEARAWLQFLDVPAADLAEVLAAVGIRRRPVMPRDMATIYVAVKNAGFELAFTSADLCPGHEALKATAPVLAGILLPLATYKGSIPFGIRRRDSQASLRKRLGRPERKNPDTCSDLWTLQDLSVEVEYTADLGRLARIAILLS